MLKIIIVWLRYLKTCIFANTLEGNAVIDKQNEKDYGKGYNSCAGRDFGRADS